MFKKISAIIFTFLIIGLAVKTGAQNLSKTSGNVPQVEKVNISEMADYASVQPLNLVNQSSKYLNKKVKFKAKFDKFCTIGLDYAPVKKDSKNYISFLIKRENVTDYNIPLSELKLMVKRDFAEKELINIEAGDEIEIYGKVFSLALGDPWVEVDKVLILNPKEKKVDKDNK